MNLRLKVSKILISSFKILMENPYLLQEIGSTFHHKTSKKRRITLLLWTGRIVKQNKYHNKWLVTDQQFVRTNHYLTGTLMLQWRKHCSFWKIMNQTSLIKLILNLIQIMTNVTNPSKMQILMRIKMMSRNQDMKIQMLITER